jgi:hypothetical protein
MLQVPEAMRLDTVWANVIFSMMEKFGAVSELPEVYLRNT